jgi:putative chitinase
MPFVLQRKDWREIFPKAPDAIIDAFTNNPGPLDKAGITKTRTRLAYALGNIEHECGGYAIKNLTESIAYTAKRMAEIWPSRFASAAAVEAKYGTAKGWQKKAFDDIYGNRMGNRPGTSDGSTYIGRGGPQITGRDGYREVGKRCDLNLVDEPTLASAPEHQPAILAAFWTWKDLNQFADEGNFKGCVKKWNGGLIGFADRKALVAGNDPIINRLLAATALGPTLDKLKS